MRWTILASAVSLAALLVAPAVAVPSDFRLPPDPATQQPEPDRQGPVAPDVPESRGPRPTPAPTASRTPAPTPAPTAAEPRIVPLDLDEPQEPRTRRAPAATPTSSAANALETDALPVEADDFASPAANTAPATLPSVPTSVSTPTDEGGSIWPWILGVLAVLGAIGVAGWVWKRRQRVAVPTTVPQLERGRLAPAASPEPAEPSPALPSQNSGPLQVTLEPLRLSLTLMNATLAYRLEIANRGAAAIEGLNVGADMISAHASLTREQQLSGPVSAATVQRIDRLAPGESRVVEGEFRVPFTQIVPIRQGKTALLLPLARFRLEAEGAAPVVRTFVVGQPGANAALQPFRLDLGPRVYPKLVQRAFA